MRVKDIRNLSVDELTAKVSELHEEIVHLRLRKGTGQLENPMKMRNVKRDLARALTIAKQRQEGSGA